jgi:hypothetical protein
MARPLFLMLGLGFGVKVQVQFMSRIDVLLYLEIFFVNPRVFLLPIGSCDPVLDLNVLLTLPT